MDPSGSSPPRASVCGPAPTMRQLKKRKAGALMAKRDCFRQLGNVKAWHYELGHTWIHTDLPFSKPNFP